MRKRREVEARKGKEMRMLWKKTEGRKGLEKRSREKEWKRRG